MHKTRRLVDENSVSFQTFLILLSFLTLGSEKTNFCVQAMSKQHLDVCVIIFYFGGGGGTMRKSQNLVFSVKKKKS